MNMNKKMQDILSLSNSYDKKIIFSSKSFRRLLLPDFISVFGCVLIKESSDDTLFSASEEEFENFVKKAYHDKTGYEASNSETLINYFIDDSCLTSEDILSVAFTVMDVWGKQLKSIDSKNNFCVLVSCDREDGKHNFVTIRFHKIRDNEPMWLGDDLEGFNQPVGYLII